MKIKKEYIILAVVIFTLVGYLLVRKTNRLHYTLPATPAIKKSDITKIELQSGDRGTTLIRKEGSWFITPGDYPADSGKIDKIISVVTDFSITTLISEAGDYPRYDLTKDKEIAVKVSGKEGPLFSFAVGKHAPTFQHTFVTIAGDKNVYLAQGNFHSDFDQSTQELRDKHVLDFSRVSLSAITITEGDKTLELKKPQQKEEADKTAKTRTVRSAAVGWTGTGGKAIPEAAMNDLFSALDNLQCQSYLEGKKKDAFKDPILEISLQGEKNATLSIFEKTDAKATAYPALSSINSYPFSLQEYKFELIKKAVNAVRVEKNEPQPGAEKKPVEKK